MADPSRPDMFKRMGGFEMAVLAVPAIWAPARLASNNLAGIPHLERMVALALVMWVVFVGLAYVLTRLTGHARASTYAIFVFGTLAVSMGGVSRSIGTALSVVLLLVVALLVYVLTRQRESSVAIRALAVGLAVALLAGPTTDAVSSIINYGESDVIAVEGPDVELTARPDIWLVVLDGYPGVQSLGVAHDAAVDPGLVAGLAQAGFEIPRSVWASYPSTKQSVPSLLQMGYPLTEWSESDATTGDLYGIIGGENQLVHALNENGYETVMLESGWSGSSCGSGFDHCSPSPLHDSAADYILNESFLGAEPIAKPGVSFAISSQDTMEQLLELAGSPSSSEPRFVFAHVLAPHPPFFLDGRCDRSLQAEGAGFFYPYPGVDGATRDSLFSRQLECVNGFLREFVSQLDPSSVVVLVADHGTGRRAQMAEEPSVWDEVAVVERMNPFLALRTPETCVLGDGLVLPNVMRRVLSCLGDGAIDEVPPRIFLSGNHELTKEEVEELLAGVES